MKEALATLLRGEDLESSVVEATVGRIMDGEASPVQIAAFLSLLASKGETVAELVAVVRAVRARAVHLDVDGPLLDTCGTGGDGQGTFNISTATAFVAAAAGAVVAKHGNRAASGRVGAADVLEALGARIDIPAQASRRALREIGIAFLFAPIYHPAFKHVGPVRKELGFRTVFNMVGPLCNPAGATHQLLGLFAREWMRPVAEALRELGSVRALIVHGSDGSDEITTLGPTHAVELRDGEIGEFSIDPEALGVPKGDQEAIAGSDAEGNAELIRSILSGDGGAAADIVAINAAGAIYVAGLASTLKEGVESARSLMRSGAASSKLDEFVAFTKSCA